MTPLLKPLHQQISRQQVTEVVSCFYQKAQQDELLAPYFADVADWPTHEGYVVDFWWGVMGGTVAEPRPGAMLTSHRGLDFGRVEMERWLALFGECIDERIEPQAASQWREISRHIAGAMAQHGLLNEGEE